MSTLININFHIRRKNSIIRNILQQLCYNTALVENVQFASSIFRKYILDPE